MQPFFFCELQLIKVLLFNRDSYTKLKHKVRFSKSVWWILQNLYFCSTKSMDPLALQRHNFFQN